MSIIDMHEFKKITSTPLCKDCKYMRRDYTLFAPIFVIFVDFVAFTYLIFSMQSSHLYTITIAILLETIGMISISLGCSIAYVKIRSDLFKFAECAHPNLLINNSTDENMLYITGDRKSKKRMMYCGVLRSQHNYLCGIEGKFFEKREKQNLWDLI